MSLLFYLSSGVGIVATFMALTGRNIFHALLYLVVSFLAVAIVFFALGAPFVAMLEIIIYAGAIMVLFIFVVMMLNLGERATRQEQSLLHFREWIGPGLLSLILLAELFYALSTSLVGHTGGAALGPREVALSLFGPYLIGVEIASFLLLSGLVGAYHLGVRAKTGGGGG